ncbi:hypothetical protein P1P75_41940, partial [Streptomyces sp. ID05-39B]|nr:hypothetical protein [Streptomyces sp. ID05-39B]
MALTLRPRDTRLAANSRGTGLALRRFTTTTKLQETFGAYGRFGARQSRSGAAEPSGEGDTRPAPHTAALSTAGAALVGAGRTAPAPGSGSTHILAPADGPREAVLDPPDTTPPDP